MWLDISTYCNAACPQCHRTNPRTLGKVDWLPLVQWSYDQFVTSFPVRIMQHIAKFEFCGTWGDPVMNKDLFQMCEYIMKNSECGIQINTNGSIRDESWWWDLGVLCGQRLLVMVDIDGSTQEIHALYRQKTDLQKIINNMKSLTATRARLGVFTVVFKHNQDDLLNIAKLSKSIGADHCVFVSSNRFNQRDKFKYYNNNELIILERETIRKDRNHPFRNSFLKNWDQRKPYYYIHEKDIPDEL
jgi:MoaA/NifB/PqqE/SkfB family radical SAM enzyme